MSRIFSTTTVVVLLLVATVRAQRAEELDLDTLPSDPAFQAPVPDLDQVEEQIVSQTNEFRESHNLKPLTTNAQLHDAAQCFADYMARTSKYGHNADGQTPAQRAAQHDYDYCIVLENIAYRYSSRGFTAGQLADGFVTGWKNSQGHRENMLDSAATETAVAVAHSKESGNLFSVQLFGRPKSAAIEFRIANMADEAVNYTVAAQRARSSSSSKEDASATNSPFDLPPRAIMTHERCRPSQIHFSWMEKGKVIKPESGMTYTIRSNGDGGYEVTQAQSRE